MTGEWILGIQINGEWEHCRFASRTLALGAFQDLTSDYGGQIQGAVLIAAALCRIVGSPGSPLVQ